jgi:hypothetical protein
MALASLYKGLGKKSDGLRGCTDVAALVGLLAPGGSEGPSVHWPSCVLTTPAARTASGSAGASRRWFGCWRLAALLPYRSALLRRWQTYALQASRTRTAREGEGCVRGEGQVDHVNNPLLPSQPGALRRLVWRRWPEQGSPEGQAVQYVYDSAVAWASEPDE